MATPRDRRTSSSSPPRTAPSPARQKREPPQSHASQSLLGAKTHPSLHHRQLNPHALLSVSSLESLRSLGSAFSPRRREKAARQQGGFFFRENSANGGKAIRAFWLHPSFGQNRCQGQNFQTATHS